MKPTRGPVAWMAKNPVAANLLMIVLVVGGLLASRRVKQEVFPELEMDLVTVSVAYPGASPAEVEQGVLLVVEEAVQSLDQVKRVKGNAGEGIGVVRVELELGADTAKAVADVKAVVDRIRSLPQDAERPVVALAVQRRQAISLIVYGDVDERALRTYAERARDTLLHDAGISQVELGGVRPLEVGIEVPQAALRKHGITLQQVASRVRQASVELPAGGLKTAGGEVLLRTDERKDLGSEFGDIRVVTSADGGHVRLGDIAEVVDGFRDTDESAWFDGKRAVMVTVYRVGDQTPMHIADTVHRYIEEESPQLPEGVSLTYWNDQSESYRGRIDLLLRNAWIGLILVLGILGLFLEMRLAFWVALGIPISFLGAMLFLPAAGTSLNMVSLFAFIVTLGIVVDDAIVVGENIFLHRQQGKSLQKAAVDGVREIASPVTFSVLTTIVAFSPLLFVPGVMGKIFTNIPVIVISVLAVSLAESLFVLPAHLSRSKPTSTEGFFGPIVQRQQAFSKAVETAIQDVYQPVLRTCVRRRWLTASVCVAILMATLGFVGSGRIEFTFLPRIESDIVRASARLPFGAPIEATLEVQRRLIEAVEAEMAALGGRDKVARGVFSRVGRSLSRRGGAGAFGSHIAGVSIAMQPPGVRVLSARALSKRWREAVGDLPGLELLSFTSQHRHGGGQPIDVQLSHADIGVLAKAAGNVAAQLRTYAGVTDIDDGFSAGKPQIGIKLRPEAKALGLTQVDVARQVRSSFFGAEALRQQRGRDEVRVMVRLPEIDRRSEHTFETLLVRTPGGGEVPLARVANIDRGRAYNEINREGGRRIVHVTADVVPGVGNANKVLSDMRKERLPAIMAKFDGLQYSLEGQRRERRESLGALGRGFVLAMLVIFALLAIPFRSYVQPLVVMSAIPFGFVGAIFGHVLLGYDLSLISMFGIVALSGIVVNDSLVLMVAVNGYRDGGVEPFESVVLGAMRRFRPIILTSLTTFFGLVPIIVETSMQARFLIPMALSLGFGVLFSTFVILLLVPSLYMMVEDLRRLLGLADREPLASVEAMEALEVEATSQV